ncbi:MAG: hypothetical protein M3R47_09730 [Chloroflexota bacterium]|nr:hypothetical protein [Chloroflexota bacterium]
MPALDFTLATPADDESLRRLLRENPIPGSLSLTFEREPCYFDAAAIEGSFHQTIVAREKDSGNVIAFGNRSVRKLFLNGHPQDIGYMSQLRVRPDYGKGLYLARGLAGGFKKYHQLHQDGRAPFYLMSIIEDNLPARRLLQSGLPEYPYIKEYARMFTYTVYPVRQKAAMHLPRSLKLTRGTDQYAAGIIDCLNRNGSRKQLAPYWTCESLFTSNLSPSDFFVVLEGDRVVACLACWNQNAFKQTVVRGYSGSLARWRKLLNMFSSLGAWPYLPEPNTPLRYSYASHLAIDNDDPHIFAALLRAVYNHNLERGYSYFVIGQAETNPLRTVVKPYRPLTYVSQLYLVTWDHGQKFIEAVDKNLIPAPEIAVL